MQTVKQQASAFALLKNAESLASAKSSLLVSLMNRSFGIAIINDQLVMVEGVFLTALYLLSTHITAHSVLTMYEKSSTKAVKHSWTSSTTSIGALSYLVVWCYQHTQQQQF